MWVVSISAQFFYCTDAGHYDGFVPEWVLNHKIKFITFTEFALKSGEIDSTALYIRRNLNFNKEGELTKFSLCRLEQGKPDDCDDTELLDYEMALVENEWRNKLSTNKKLDEKLIYDTVGSGALKYKKIYLYGHLVKLEYYKLGPPYYLSKPQWTAKYEYGKCGMLTKITTDGIGLIDYQTITKLKFDDNCNLIELTKFGKSDFYNIQEPPESTYITKFQYNNNGLLEKQIFYNGLNESLSIGVYEYEFWE